MKFFLPVLLLLIEISISAQTFSYKKLSESFDRDEFDITSSIPFKGGLLSVVMDKKNSFNAKYSLKVCTVSENRKIQKNIKIGFEGEAFFRLIGIFQINDKPIIFYTTYASYKKVLHIKAIVLDPETLQAEATKEIRELPLYKDDTNLIFTGDSDAMWMSPVTIRLSQDSTRYLLVYRPITGRITSKNGIAEVYLAIIDANANLVFDKTEAFPLKSGIVRIQNSILAKNGKIYTLFTLLRSKSSSETQSFFLGITDTKEGKLREIPFDKSIGIIRDASFLYKNKLTDNIEILGTYSEDESEYEFNGVYQLEFNLQAETLKTIIKKELPNNIRLSNIYPEYGAEGSGSKNSYKIPLYDRIHKVHSGYRNNGTIDYTVEYISRGQESITYREGIEYYLYYLSLINFSFSNNDIACTVVEKKQIAKNSDIRNVCGIKAFLSGNKLVYFYNDFPGNLDLDSKPKPFEPHKKDDCSLVAAIIDEKGNLSKQEITSTFPKKYFPEPNNAIFLDEKTLILRVASPDTRYKKSDIAFVTIEE